MAGHGPGRDTDLAAVAKTQGHARPHVLVALARDLRVHHHADALHQSLDRRIIGLVVAEGRDAHAPVAERGRCRELTGELGLEPAPRIRVNEDPWNGRPHAHRDLLDLLGRNGMDASELERAVDDRMRAGAGRVGLDGHARLEDLPRRAQRLERPLFALARAQHREVALRTLERLLGGGESVPSEQGREHAAPRRVPGVERLGHRAEVLLEPRGLAGRDGERGASLRCIEAEQARRRRRRAHGAERACGVKSLLVVRRIEHLGQRGLDFEAEQESVDQGAAIGQRQLARRERRREHGRSGMAHHGEVRVVEVESMGRRAVGEGGPDGAGAERRAHHGGERRAAF